MKQTMLISKTVNQTIVEIFKTNVNSQQLAKRIVSNLNQLYPDYLINFDLEDCDKILRIASTSYINTPGIIAILEELNVKVSIVED